MDYKKIFETMVEETEKYLKINKLHTMVLGISGGLDSTITAAICSEVERRNPDIKFIGVSLPCSSNTKEENDSASLCGKGFCKPNQFWIENIQKEYLLLKATCDQHAISSFISQGNIKARIRMIYLYNLASTTNGLVMDTDNLTEHYLGFFTINGDVGDYNPIGGLWKHELYELAKYLLYDYYNTNDMGDGLNYKQMALRGAIGINPTDGNGVNNQGDMGQIAPEFIKYTNIEAYANVDDIINTYLNICGKHPEEYRLELNNLYNKYNVDTVDNIIERIRKTSYKRNKLPIIISREKFYI